MSRLRRLLRFALLLSLVLLVLGVGGVGVLYWLISPRLPSVEALRDVRLQVPLRVEAEDGRLIALFGETRRTPVRIEDVPKQVRDAFIAIEDARFYEHPGFDAIGIGRAAWLLLTTDRERVPGGSTITQQVARNFFLSAEYSYSRKLHEIFLAVRMERELSKDEILELYLNKIFFGNRAYGVVAAADFYYGKTLAELSLPEAAMLAALPKAPSSGNPISNPQRAMMRRNYVLTRMHEEAFISRQQLEAALAAPDYAVPHEPAIELDAPYMAEMVRQAATDRLGPEALTGGFVVRTTIDARAQEAANLAVRAALTSYDRRHGYRGPEASHELQADDTPSRWQQMLRNHRTLAGMLPALVTEVDSGSATLFLGDGQSIALPMAAMAWARPYVSENRRGAAPRTPGEIVGVGDVVRVMRNAEGEWELGQLPRAQGALVSLDPETGAIRALNGGFSFHLNKFNRAIQSQRQPGSSFKPFIYAAAFERGYTPASIVLDAPVVFTNPYTGQTWRPQNDNAKFAGPMRLREAMVTSRNLVSVRILDAIGVGYARGYIQNFGFPAASLPENLSMSLGTSSVPPLTVARGYTVFANGGYLVEPHFIAEIRDRNGMVVFQERPLRACSGCPERLLAEQQRSVGGFDLSVARSEGSSVTAAEAAGPPESFLAPRAIDERTSFLISSLLRDVVKRGTGRGALALERDDVGGKTGTTNEYRDAWFSGFAGPLVATAWVGMDDFSPLGSGEFASKTALPMWVEFMKVALDGVPEKESVIPNGIVTANIDRGTGLLLSGGGGMPEYFKAEDIARLESRMATSGENAAEQETFDIF